MRRKLNKHTPPNAEIQPSTTKENEPYSKEFDEIIPPQRSTMSWYTIFILFLIGFWVVYYFQYERLPIPRNTDEAGKRGFSEDLAMEHVKALTKLGPHTVGSNALDLAIQYVLDASEFIKKTAHWEVDVQVDLFHVKSGANTLVGGMFKGKTLIYADLNHVVLRIVPKYLPEAKENVLLVSSHIDTVFSTEGAGDCSSCVASMLELARVISQWAHGFKNGVIFLFNTGEEEGLNGAHSFITQHPWRHSVRFFIDLEAMGIGGKSGLFQSGSTPWAIETFARVAKYPSAQVVSQDLFHSGVIKSATDFQVYSEVGGLPGIDFAYTDSNVVYHTKNDKLKLLKPGSLQHLGENMLAFIIETAMSAEFPKDNLSQGTDQEKPVFFDILGSYMIVYRQHFASMLQNSVILQAVLIWVASLFVGGYQAVTSMGLSFLTIILMWIFSLSLSSIVAFLLPWVCDHPAPYIANPWLVLGLFGAPAVVGALGGQHFGFLILYKHLCNIASRKGPIIPKQVNLFKMETERWLFKAGFLQWLIILVLGSFYKVGSSYIALAWLISPAFSYGLIEATLTPTRSPKQLRILTLLLGLTIPILLSGGVFIRLVEFGIGGLVRFNRNPGSTPDWLGNIVIGLFTAVVVCLVLVYILSYIHLSGAKKSVITSMCALFVISLAAVSFGIFPTFTSDAARSVNVVHVIDTTAEYGENVDPVSYVSFFSMTPGKLTNEQNYLKTEEFSCGRNQTLDLITFSAKYWCWSSKDTTDGWTKLDIPGIHVESDLMTDVRRTQVLVNTKTSVRWSLAINCRYVEDFTLKAISDDSPLVGNKCEGETWHTVQFSGGKAAPTKFTLTLSWFKNATHPLQKAPEQGNPLPLLKLRTDMDRVTPKVSRVLDKLPPWCSQFGKSTSPFTLAFLTSLPIDFRSHAVG